MTKEKYINYKGILHCQTCNRDVPNIHIYYKKIHDDGSILRCNACNWIKNHLENMEFNTFSYQEIQDAVFFYFYNESSYLNDLAEILNRSLKDVLNLHKYLNIGNKKTLVKTICERCGKECEFTPHAFIISKYHYCSHECYFEDKSNKIPKGDNNPCFNRIKTTCTNCSKEIEIIPYQYNKKNELNESNNFCCQQCYWEYRSKYYCGDKWTGTREKTKETIEKMRLASVMRLKNEPIQVNSKIQLIVNNILDQLNISYEREYAIKYYSIDNYLTENNLAIEVMGDYWHANPLIYKKDGRNINNTQYKDIISDKKKHSYVSRYRKMEILYLWETDILTNIDLIKELIKEYINNNGVLDNYQSFNYKLFNNKLEINENIIYPYFLLDKKYAQKILK